MNSTGLALLLGVVLVGLVGPVQPLSPLSEAQEVYTSGLRQDEAAQLQGEAVEHLRGEATARFAVIPESFRVSVDNEQAWVNYMVVLDNGELMYVAVLFKREEGRWRYSRLGTLCCGEH